MKVTPVSEDTIIIKRFCISYDELLALLEITGQPFLGDFVVDEVNNYLNFTATYQS